jgi:hypothetical protein
MRLVDGGGQRRDVMEYDQNVPISDAEDWETLQLTQIDTELEENNIRRFRRKCRTGIVITLAVAAGFLGPYCFPYEFGRAVSATIFLAAVLCF